MKKILVTNLASLTPDKTFVTYHALLSPYLTSLVDPDVTIKSNHRHMQLYATNFTQNKNKKKKFSLLSFVVMQSGDLSWKTFTRCLIKLYCVLQVLGSYYYNYNNYNCSNFYFYFGNKIFKV